MESNILSILVFLPLLGILAMFLAYMFKQKNIIYKYIALFTTFIQLLLTGWLYKNFDPNLILPINNSITPTKFVVQLPWIESFNIQYFLGVDGLSMPLILLTSLLMFICILSSWNIDKYVFAYFALFLLLDTGMIGVFATQSQMEQPEGEALLVEDSSNCTNLNMYEEFLCEYQIIAKKIESLIIENEGYNSQLFDLVP